jgi:hypothetical protein
MTASPLDWIPLPTDAFLHEGGSVTRHSPTEAWVRQVAVWPRIPFFDNSGVANMHGASNDLCDVNRRFDQGAMDDAPDNRLFDYHRLLNDRLHDHRLLDHRLHNTVLDDDLALGDGPPEYGFVIDVVSVKRRSTRRLLHNDRPCSARPPIVIIVVPPVLGVRGSRHRHRAHEHHAAACK